MSRPKQNLTPAQRKAYEARMRQLRRQQQRRRRVIPKVGMLGRRLTAEQRRKLLAQQRLNRMRLDQQRKAGKKIRRLKPVAMTPQQRRKLLAQQRKALRPTKATQKPLSPYKRKVAKPQRVTQPPPPRRVVRSQVRRRAPVVRARGRG
tara:strand:+ start:63 stop:506 length:444 start_codon:yes stop_codon:yes gene_type:complete